MAAIEQIFATYREFNSGRHSIAEMSVHRVVAGHVETRELVYITNDYVVLQMLNTSNEDLT